VTLELKSAQVLKWLLLALRIKAPAIIDADSLTILLVPGPSCETPLQWSESLIAAQSVTKVLESFVPSYSCPHHKEFSQMLPVKMARCPSDVFISYDCLCY